MELAKLWEHETVTEMVERFLRRKNFPVIQPDELVSELYIRAKQNLPYYNPNHAKFEGKGLEEKEKFRRWLYWQMRACRQTLTRRMRSEVEMELPLEEQTKDGETDANIDREAEVAYRLWVVEQFSVSLEEVDEAGLIIEVIDEIIKLFGCGAKNIKRISDTLIFWTSFVKEKGREPTDDEIARGLKCSVRTAKTAWGDARAQVKYKLEAKKSETLRSHA